MAGSSAVTVALARVPADRDAAKALFLAYAESLGFSLCFQGFDREIADFPGAYAEPAGCLLLARVAGAAVGAVGLRPLDRGACEMKRLYVRPDHRGLGLGRRLVARLLAEARARGYAVMRLDTLDTMVEAGRLYEALGFRAIPAYYDNPLSGARYFERALADVDISSQAAP